MLETQGRRRAGRPLRRAGLMRAPRLAALADPASLALALAAAGARGRRHDRRDARRRCRRMRSCAAFRSGQPPGEPASPAASIANPYEGDAAAVAEGKALFCAMNCVYCHGDNGSGPDRAGAQRPRLALRRRAGAALQLDPRRPSAGHAGLGRAPAARPDLEAGRLPREPRRRRAAGDPPDGRIAGAPPSTTGPQVERPGRRTTRPTRRWSSDDASQRRAARQTGRLDSPSARRWAICAPPARAPTRRRR